MALTDLPKTTGGLYIPPKGYPDWHEPINENFKSIETQINNKNDSLKDATAKTTPVDADALPLIDSAASNATKKITWANIKNAVKSFIYGLYHGYVTCNTAAATAAKAVTQNGFVLEAGASIKVKFTYANTATNPMLNVTSNSVATGAKSIFYKGVAAPNDLLVANIVYEFVYNGTQYDLIGIPDVYTKTEIDTQLDNKVSGKWTFYNSLAELGIEAGKETIESIISKMVGGSSLRITFSGISDSTEVYPCSAGTLYIEKVHNVRSIVRATNISSNKEWRGSYQNSTWKGWQEVPITYTSLADLNISVGTETIEKIVTSMEVGSVLRVPFNVGVGGNADIYPTNSGSLIIEKVWNYRPIVRVVGTYGKNEWLGSYHSEQTPVWQGWRELYHDSQNIVPSVDNTYNLGSSTFRWKNIFGTSGAVSSSDKNLKDKIKSLSWEQIRNFIMSLNPVSYEFTDNGKEPEERRTHMGFISQEVEKAMYENGLNTLDFAGLIISPITKEVESGEYTEKTIKDENGEEQIVKVPVMKTVITGERYGLRYEEFIAPMLKMLQSHEERLNGHDGIIQSLKNRIGEQDSLIENMSSLIQSLQSQIEEKF